MKKPWSKFSKFLPEMKRACDTKYGAIVWTQKYKELRVIDPDKIDQYLQDGATLVYQAPEPEPEPTQATKTKSANVGKRASKKNSESSRPKVKESSGRPHSIINEEGFRRRRNSTWKRRFKGPDVSVRVGPSTPLTQRATHDFSGWSTTARVEDIMKTTTFAELLAAKLAGDEIDEMTTSGNIATYPKGMATEPINVRKKKKRLGEGVTLSDAAARHVSGGPQCGSCDQSLPKYPGRYPHNCPGCGESYHGGEESPDMIEHHDYRGTFSVAQDEYYKSDDFTKYAEKFRARISAAHASNQATTKMAQSGRAESIEEQEQVVTKQPLILKHIPWYMS